MTESNKVRTRFAPSPTGFMHIGNLRSALYEYLVAKSHKGAFILRIEDTDQDRIVEGSIEVIYRTLSTCGLIHDEGPDIGGPYAPYIQSERLDRYLPYATRLVEEGKAYYCFCNRAEQTEAEYNGYDRRCRDLPAEEVAAHMAAGDSFVIRQKMPLTGETSFTDQVFGTITVENKELEDQVLIKSDGFPTYNFANVIDDHEMGITHVVRGSEYLSSTPKYNLLYEALGWEIPIYVHLPLILGEDGSKLSKRHCATSFADLVELGYLPEAIINYIAFLGWSPGDDTRELFTLQELENVFSTSGINKSPAIFSLDKLNWFNEQYLRDMPGDDFIDLIRPWTDKVFGDRFYDLSVLASVLQTRIHKLADIPDLIDFMVEPDPLTLDLYVQKRSKLRPESALEILEHLYPILEELRVWSHDSIKEELDLYLEQSGHKLGRVMGAIRPSLSGRNVTPGGAIEMLLILGREESLRRLGYASEYLRQQS
ncbi:MAG TPA: glutamate--tRNA ligase [Clostridiaceae bacterium]|nr:glutamate--tRNA ligase [Clostridiaceae bacterium]